MSGRRGRTVAATSLVIQRRSEIQLSIIRPALQTMGRTDNNGFCRRQLINGPLCDDDRTSAPDESSINMPDRSR